MYILFENTMNKEYPYIDALGNQVNDETAAMISAIMQSGRQKRNEIRYLFTKFIESLGYKAWHIENGWFRSFGFCYGRDINDRLEYSGLNFTWFMDFHGAYGGKVPEKGDDMIIIDYREPEHSAEHPRKVFKLHCYNVKSILTVYGDGMYERNSSSHWLYLEKIETKLAYFDSKEGYKIYVSNLTKFKLWVKNLFKKNN